MRSKLPISKNKEKYLRTNWSKVCTTVYKIDVEIVSQKLQKTGIWPFILILCVGHTHFSEQAPATTFVSPALYLTVLPTHSLKLYNTIPLPLPTLAANVLQKRIYPTMQSEIQCINL